MALEPAKLSDFSLAGALGTGTTAKVWEAVHKGSGRPVAIKILKRQFAGDGDFLMHGQEFATAVQYGLPIIVVLLDNAMYGTIRMHQEREYPGRISATQLKNPDFKAYAQAFGGHGERVERTEDFAPALARARAVGATEVVVKPCLPDQLGQIVRDTLAQHAPN